MRLLLLLAAGYCILPAQTSPARVSDANPAVLRATQPREAPVKAAEARPISAEPHSKSETLHFNVNWPSGLSLGEGEMTSNLTPQGWSFSYRVDAGIPGFSIAESAKSTATMDFCSIELSKEGTRGKKQTRETTEFDAAKLTATRTTANGGGKTEVRSSPCAKDALTFVQFVRRELAAGRLPAAQPVFYGAQYQTRVQFTGTQRITSGTESIEADRLTATLKGPATELTVELFFARDAARTPVLAQIPLAMGKFSVEFARP